jgi:hypothetical protein
LHLHQSKKKTNKGCYRCGEKGNFIEVCPNKPTPKTKKARKAKHLALTTIKTWDDSSSEDEAQYKGSGHKHSSSSTSHVCLMA